MECSEYCPLSALVVEHSSWGCRAPPRRGPTPMSPTVSYQTLDATDPNPSSLCSGPRQAGPTLHLFPFQLGCIQRISSVCIFISRAYCGTSSKGGSQGNSRHWMAVQLAASHPSPVRQRLASKHAHQEAMQRASSASSVRPSTVLVSINQSN